MEEMLYDLKRANRIRIYNIIRQKGNMSRRDLSYELQLSLPTISQNLTDLVDEGYIRETGTIGQERGRRASLYSICENARVAIGLDITKNHITIVAVNLNFESVYTKRIKYPFERSEKYHKKLLEMIKETTDHPEMDATRVEGVGMAVPGLIEMDGFSVFYGASLDFTGMTLDEFAQKIPFPCCLYNDADAAGYAEAQIGTAISDSFYISLNNSVGGAILINGQVYKGECSKSGEIGHTTLYMDGATCFCGRKGCLDVYCNATVLSENTDGDLKTFFQRLEERDKECETIWQNYLKDLAAGINNIRMLFDCEIIIGGYVGAYMEPYLEDLKKLVLQRNPFEKQCNYLHICKVKGAASAMGAALPFVQRLVDNI